MSNKDHSKENQIRLKGNYFAEPYYFRTDVTTGVCRTPSGQRICTLPPDFLLGLRDALIYECGKSYRQVLKSAGRRWGTQWIKRIDRELSTYYQVPLRELPRSLVRICMRDAFAAYGYGQLHYYATEFTNFWNVELIDSVFPTLVNESDRPVDLLMSGLIAALFSHLYGATMDSLQTECPSMGAEYSRFIVGPAARIAELEAWYNSLSPLPSHEQVLQQIPQLESVQHKQDNEKSAVHSVMST
jgi:predicted hydrocarbon binding protein